MENVLGVGIHLFKSQLELTHLMPYTAYIRHGRVMDSGWDCGMGKPCSNSSQVCYIHLHANEKGMNPSPLFLAIVKLQDRLSPIAFVGKWFRRRTTVN